MFAKLDENRNSDKMFQGVYSQLSCNPYCWGVARQNKRKINAQGCRSSLFQENNPTKQNINLQ